MYTGTAKKYKYVRYWRKGGAGMTTDPIVPQIVKTKISVLLRESPFTDRLMNTNENASRKDSNALGVSGQLPLSTENSFHFFVFQAHHLWKQERSGFVKGK
jgi:hypothetical protein